MVRPSSAVRSTEGIGSILIMNTGQACIHNSAAQAALTHMACRGAPLPDDPGTRTLQLGLNLRQGGVVEVVPGGLLQGAERVPHGDSISLGRPCCRVVAELGSALAYSCR